MITKKLKLKKYITNGNIKKLKKFIHLNIETIHEFNDEYECYLFDALFSTTLLYYLFANDLYDLAKEILSKGFDVYKGYDTCLMVKILNNKETNVKYLKLLVEFNYDVNHKAHKDLSTLLHMSCIACNVEAVNYLLENGAVSFNYKNDANNIDMQSFIFGVDDNITPLCLVNEMTNESAIQIVYLLLNSLPDINQLKFDSKKSEMLIFGSNTDIDNLLCVALLKNFMQIIHLLYLMNFNFISFKMRTMHKCKNKIQLENYKNLIYFKQNSNIFKLKELCRLRIRSYLGTLDLNKSKSYRPNNCIYEVDKCNFISAPKTFLKRLNSLPLPVSLVNYLNFNPI